MDGKFINDILLQIWWICFVVGITLFIPFLWYLSICIRCFFLWNKRSVILIVVLSSSLQHKTGLPISTYFSAVKLRWLLDNVDDVRQAVLSERAMFGTVDSWIIWVRAAQSLQPALTRTGSRGAETRTSDEMLCVSLEMRKEGKWSFRPEFCWIEVKFAEWFFCSLFIYSVLCVIFPQCLTGGRNGGVHCTDVSNASRTMLFNIHTMDWDPELCR